MILLGQLLDVINENELLTIRSSHERSLVFIDEVKAQEAKTLLTKDSRKCVVSDFYSDISDRSQHDTVSVIYIKPNGYLITTE